jgi:ribosomal protein S18 acetylase RimI-like enzyme
MIVREALHSEMPLILKMNYDLMEDEACDRQHHWDQLEIRMGEFFDQDRYGILLFKEGSDILGYAIVHVTDEPAYLRHFYISRDYRRRGWGTKCFHAVLDFYQIPEIDLDVYYWNERGQKFWESLGFTDRCRVMNWKRT